MGNDLVVLSGELRGSIYPCDPRRKIRASWNRRDEPLVHDAIFDAAVEIIAPHCEGVPMSSVEFLYGELDDIIAGTAKDGPWGVEEFIDILDDVDLLFMVRQRQL
ncbi:hypothetical protein C4585_00270 [Candidatus Parcubacteria bacterium]|nr:MAG: hypothetical protein C4585_00270 [Candidatus Parcubacteria bacterium]